MATQTKTATRKWTIWIIYPWHSNGGEHLVDAIMRDMARHTKEAMEKQIPIGASDTAHSPVSADVRNRQPGNPGDQADVFAARVVWQVYIAVHRRRIMLSYSNQPTDQRRHESLAPKKCPLSALNMRAACRDSSIRQTVRTPPSMDCARWCEADDYEGRHSQDARLRTETEPEAQEWPAVHWLGKGKTNVTSCTEHMYPVLLDHIRFLSSRFLYLFPSCPCHS
ncbi:hypothetical protein MAPG_00403 [Magnaporthiopsis poae ATCC 64411]|uniref:Uncharacterized protein n=1 Tax=Magnaporthiopsis poae (strain ATCC 64411 / 73-15) TaxID=644358 RepID=A0A0C4DKX1_MAGP6|nr:hypothetical protein MAPG_00403 [Magnaporthiopsis poae ATCC 64411]